MEGMAAPCVVSFMMFGVRHEGREDGHAVIIRLKSRTEHDRAPTRALMRKIRGKYQARHMMEVMINGEIMRGEEVNAQ